MSKSRSRDSGRGRARLNCWEFNKCGRSPEDPDAGGAGVCPTPLEEGADGVNGGRNGGRACWTIAGTLCDGTVQGDRAGKLPTCLKCEFCQLVLEEEQIVVEIDAEAARHFK